MNSNWQKKWILIAVLTAAMVVSSAFPFDLTVVPEWKLRVLDESGRPISGARVIQRWTHSTLETENHEEQKHSDGDGYVHFPGRIIRTNLITWVAKFVARLPNLHSSYGPSASVYYQGVHPVILKPRWYEPGSPMDTKIVVNTAVTK